MALLACVSRAAPGFGLAFEILNAIAMTQETILLPLIASDLFGDKSSARVRGNFVSVCAIGYAVSSYIMNCVSDRWHSYRPILIVYAVLFAAVTVLMQVEIRRGEREREAILALEDAEGED